MSLSIKLGYVNPLPMVGQKNNNLGQKNLEIQQSQKEDNELDLFTKKQTLENQLLLMKSSSDGTALTEEMQKKFEQQIEELSVELQAMKAHATENVTVLEKSSNIQMKFDTYELQPEAQPIGLYEISRDKDGTQIIKFDDPQKESNNGVGQEKVDEKVAKDEEDKPVFMRTTVNTDAVDQEIEKLKQVREQIRQQISMAEPEKKKLLDARLSQIEKELQAKDNDMYRHQHANMQQSIVSDIGE